MAKKINELEIEICELNEYVEDISNIQDNILESLHALDYMLTRRGII